MLLRSLPSTFALLLTSLTLLTGCSDTRNEETATIDGVVTYKGEAIPIGSRLVLEDRAKGVRMTFTVEDGGKFTVGDVTQLPAGDYKVGVLPPATASPTESEYENAMDNPDANAAKPKDDDFPIPQEMRDPEKSGKSVTVASGSQTLKIEL